MRKIVIIRGPQASGKTTLIRTLGLEGHRLSADVMRAAHRGHVLNSRGELIIDQEDAHQIWDIVGQSLERRLQRGEFVIMDATFATDTTYEWIIEQADAHSYRIAIVDLYGTDENLLRERNEKRPDHERVPEKSVKRMISAYQPHPQDDERIDAHFDKDADVHDIEDWIMHEIVDLNSYERIVHIGDLQGVFKAAFQEGSPLTKELRDDTFYVFLGDALDRGIENGAVMKWIINQVSPRLGKNALWIYGNHERHLRDFIEGNDIVSREFEERTLPDLCASSPISTNDIRLFLDRTSEYLIYEHEGDTVVCTHAGIPAVPRNLTLVPAFQAVNGAGGFGTDVDTAFNDWAAEQGEPWYQVHGHRNRQMHPTRVNEHSFNLEGQAEFGGHVRMCVKTRKEWKTHDMRNDTYRSPKEWRDINKEEKRKPHSRTMPIPAWIERGEGAGKLSPETYTAFADHNHVNIRQQGELAHIEAIAFSKSAFYDRVWDGITNKARGLFVDSDSLDIVARGFDKYFHLDEHTETKREFIESDWVAPFRATEKSNGYLGLVGWDERTKTATFSSKGDMDLDFAGLFERIATEKLGPGGIERLTRAVRDLGGCAAFEVISPTEDPHIVEYDDDNIVLLAFIRRSEDYEALDYEKLVKLGAYIGVDVIPSCATLPHTTALFAYIERVRGDNPPGNVAGTEGVVIEDARGRHVKIKTKSYDLWKKARSLVERLALQRKKGQEISLDIPEELADFMAWIRKQDDEITQLPIIELRKRFLETPEDILVVDREALAREKEEAERAEREAKQIEGFMRGYNALLSQVRSDKASGESVFRLIERGNAESHLKTAMEARPEHAEMLAYIEEDEE